MLLKVFQSVEVRYPFWEVPACNIERVAVVVFHCKGVVAKIEVVPKVDEPPPVEVSVVPVKVRPVPIVNVFTGDTPLPIKMPVRVEEPVPPPVGKRIVACATIGSNNVADTARAVRSFLNILKEIVSKQNLPRLCCHR